MSILQFGQIFDSKLGLIELVLPEDTFLIWREGTTCQAVLCQSMRDVPAAWIKDVTPWQIFGTFNLIKKVFPGCDFPIGSKLIDLLPKPVLRLDLVAGTCKFRGERKKRLVIVDDSPTIRKLLKHVIEAFDGWEVVAMLEKAADLPQTIRDFYPDLITLDLHLGEIDGLAAMKQFIAPRRIPTLLITSQAKEDGRLVMETLEAGALDYLQKPESGSWGLLAEELLLKMEGALRSKWQQQSTRISRKVQVKATEYSPENYLVAIGSSTGGTQALQEILTQLPELIPPILITQHIPAGFSRALAERLNSLCPFEVKEAVDGDLVRPGRVLIAPGDHHMKLSRNGNHVEVINSEPVNRFRPSVEVMLRSVIQNSRKKNIGIMLTGMGKDGALAMTDLKGSGAVTIAQDEKSSVIFGMPKEVIRLGGASFVKSLTEIPGFLVHLCRR